MKIRNIGNLNICVSKQSWFKKFVKCKVLYNTEVYNLNLKFVSIQLYVVVIFFGDNNLQRHTLHINIQTGFVGGVQLKIIFKDGSWPLSCLIIRDMIDHFNFL